MVNKTNNYVIIIDFGSQVTQLIARRVREIGIYCEVHNHKNFSLSNFENKPMALIFSGGPESVYEYNYKLYIANKEHQKRKFYDRITKNY